MNNGGRRLHSVPPVTPSRQLPLQVVFANDMPATLSEKPERHRCLKDVNILQPVG